jgi:hypothetical protein
MNPLKKFQHYFIGGALAKTDDVFEKVKAEVLFNFTVFFLFTNIPYLFVAFEHTIQFMMALSVLMALLLVLIVIRRTDKIRLATYFFLLNFFIQIIGHYILDNGRQELQGVLFSALFILSGFLLMDQKWGFGIMLLMVICFIVGIHNANTNFSIFRVPDDIGDPPEVGAFQYLAIIPMLLNAYLISEFVKARQKAEKQLSEQKNLIEEKQKEIIDSIRYARRIQRSQLPNEKFIEKTLERLRSK